MRSACLHVVLGCAVLAAVSACGAGPFEAEPGLAMHAEAPNPVAKIEAPPRCDRLGEAEDPRGALRACEAICDAGNGEACADVAAHAETRDPVIALALYEKSCGLGWTEGCAKAGKRRAKAQTEACATGPVTACAAAVEDLAGRCRVNESGACDAAERLDEQLAQRFCVEGSVDTCRSACDAKIVFACAQLATILINGVRVPKDVDGGVALLVAACDAEDFRACDALGDLHAPSCPPKYTCLGTPKTRPVPESPEKALGYYMRGCSKGIARECEEVLELSDGGSLAVPRGPLLVALRSVCAGGKKEACGRVRDLGEEP